MPCGKGEKRSIQITVGTNEHIVLTPVVIAALVAVIHRGAGVIYPDNATPVEPWMTRTSPVMTVWDGFGLR